MKLRKIISGGQTGADQGGLDAGIALKLETGGTAPDGFQTEKGPCITYLKGMGLVDEGLSIVERTRKNVYNADATVVFGNVKSSGSALTIATARSAKKPVIINPTATELREFLDNTGIEVLNVAGNRTSVNQQVYSLTYRTIIEAVQGK